MRKLSLLCVLLCAMAFVVAANPAQATGIFSYVSNNGSDSSNCNTPATACASFTRALSQTSNYGEIECLDAGDYGQTDYYAIGHDRLCRRSGPCGW